MQKKGERKGYDTFFPAFHRFSFLPFLGKKMSLWRHLPPFFFFRKKKGGKEGEFLISAIESKIRRKKKKEEKKKGRIFLK